jgi:hypothetical protein
MNEFTENETRLLQFMQDQGFDKDIEIQLIYNAMYPNGDAPDSRIRQQYIGGIISRINKKLTVYKIRPGALKRTYRIVSLD